MAESGPHMRDPLEILVDIEAFRVRKNVAIGELAAVVGVVESHYGDWLAGKIPLTPLQIHRLLAAYKQELWNKLFPLPGVNQINRAKPWVDASSDDDRFLTQTIDRLTLYKSLLALEAAPGPRSLPDYSDVAARLSPGAAGEAVAEAERARLGLGGGPIKNICETLRETGIVVATTAMPGTSSGLFLFARPDLIAIFATKGDSVARQRFTLAHEYAHALFDRGETAILDKHPSDDGDRPDASEIEDRANAFAAAFLVPASDLGDVIGGEAPGGIRTGCSWLTSDHVARYAARYGVSYGVMSRRLREIGAIDRNGSVRIFRDKVSLPAIPQMVGSDFVATIADLTENLRKDGKVSFNRLREVFSYLNLAVELDE